MVNHKVASKGQLGSQNSAKYIRMEDGTVKLNPDYRDASLIVDDSNPWQKQRVVKKQPTPHPTDRFGLKQSGHRPSPREMAAAAFNNNFQDLEPDAPATEKEVAVKKELTTVVEDEQSPEGIFSG